MMQPNGTIYSTTSLPQEDHWDDVGDAFLVKGIVHIFVLIYATFLLIGHSFNYYDDFCTRDRKRVTKHRRNAPEINGGYRLVSVCTLLCVVSSEIYAIDNIYNTFFVTSKMGCKISLITTCIYIFGKFCVYCVFQIRLHLVYGKSEYGISIRKQLIFFVFSLSYASFAVIYFSIFGVLQEPNGWEFDFVKLNNSNINSIIKICFITPIDWFVAVVVIFDVVFNLIYCILFIIPIFKILKNMNNNNIDDDNDKNDSSKNKMIAVGSKVSILSMVMFITTMISGFFWGGGIKNLQIDFGNLDLVIHASCIVLMTPYYPDYIFYNKLCKCCIIICADWNPIIKQSRKQAQQEVQLQLSSNERMGSVSSVDTMSAVRVNANRVAVAQGKTYVNDL